MPLGTIYNSSIANPDQDFTKKGMIAFITQNGSQGGSVGEADVDGGSTALITPAFDFTTRGMEVFYSRWMFDSLEQDVMNVEISSTNGLEWILVETISNTSGWEIGSIKLDDYVDAGENIRVKFTVSDQFEPSVVEAGIDSFYILQPDCDLLNDCAADFNQDAIVNVLDLLNLISYLGTSNSVADLNDSGLVDTIDLLELVSDFGNCD